MQTLAQSEQYDSLTEVARDPSARGKIIDGVTVITDNVIKKEEREAIISELRAANTEPKLQAALNRLNDALEGRLNLSGVVDTAGWTMNNSKGAWERLGGGQNNGGPTTPPNPATTHPFAPKNPIPMTGTGVTAETIATGINTQFPADKKTDSAHLAGLKAWIEINVPVAVRDDVIQKLKDAGYDESKLK